MLNSIDIVRGIRIVEQQLPNEYADGGVWEVKLVKKFIPREVRERQIAEQDAKIVDAQALKAKFFAEVEQIPLTEKAAEAKPQ